MSDLWPEQPPKKPAEPFALNAEQKAAVQIVIDYLDAKMEREPDQATANLSNGLEDLKAAGV